jgi:hypothetical protein
MAPARRRTDASELWILADLVGRPRSLWRDRSDPRTARSAGRVVLRGEMGRLPSLSLSMSGQRGISVLVRRVDAEHGGDTVASLSTDDAGRLCYDLTEQQNVHVRRGSIGIGYAEAG